MPAPDQPTSIVEVAAIVGDLAPDLAHLPLRLAGAGECYEAWWVGERHIIRLAKVNEGPEEEGDPSTALSAEMALLPKLREVIECPIPLPTHLGRQPNTGRAVLLHEAVLGQPLLPDRWAQLTVDERKSLALALGRFLAQLQAFPPQRVTVALVHRDFCRAPVHDPAIERLVFSRMRPNHVEHCRRVAAGFNPGSPANRVLVHGDLYNHHILVTADARLAGVIDFGDMGWGDPAWDLGTLMDDFGVGFVRDVLSDRPDDVARDQLRRARYFCVWEALGWAAEELGEGREDEVDENLARVGELASLDLDESR